MTASAPQGPVNADAGESNVLNTVTNTVTVDDLADESSQGAMTPNLGNQGESTREPTDGETSADEAKAADFSPNLTRVNSREDENRSVYSTPAADLSYEQLRTINIARSSLTRNQRARIERRHARISRSREPSPGPSNLSKGKGVDPRNWGHISDFSEHEHDPRVQQAIMNAAKDLIKKGYKGNDSDEDDNAAVNSDAKRNRNAAKKKKYRAKA